jgi:hypothetical protein
MEAVRVFEVDVLVSFIIVPLTFISLSV